MSRMVLYRIQKYSLKVVAEIGGGRTDWDAEKPRAMD